MGKKSRWLESCWNDYYGLRIPILLKKSELEKSNYNTTLPKPSSSNQHDRKSICTSRYNHGWPRPVGANIFSKIRAAIGTGVESGTLKIEDIANRDIAVKDVFNGRGSIAPDGVKISFSTTNFGYFIIITDRPFYSLSLQNVESC